MERALVICRSLRVNLVLQARRGGGGGGEEAVSGLGGEFPGNKLYV